MLGWTIVFLGCASVPFGWNLGRTTGIIEVVLTVLTILAGLVLVWQNISALNEYLHIPFPIAPQPEPEKKSPLSEIRRLMKEVDDGGWQEAYAAIGQLTEIHTKYSLPKLE